MASPRIEGRHFSPDTRAFLRQLVRHRVRYLIVGGEAVIYYGHVRLTGDVDFFFSTAPRDRVQLFRALEGFWDGDVPGLSSDADLAEEGLIVQFGVPPNRIDLISSLDGIDFEQAWKRRQEVILALDDGEYPIFYIGLDDLIRNKEASGRPKDLDDLPYLRRARADGG